MEIPVFEKPSDSVLHEPLPSPALGRVYDERVLRHGRDYKACHYHSRRSFESRLAALRRLTSGLPLGLSLDIGCGPGLLAGALGISPLEMVGLDISLEMLEAARGTERPVQGEAARLPFKNGAFQSVIGLEILQHMRRPEDCLREALRVLRPGGILILSALSRDSFLHFLNRPFGGYARLGLQFHDLPKITRALASRGCALEKIIYLGYPLPRSWEALTPSRISGMMASSWMLRARRAA